MIKTKCIFKKVDDRDGFRICVMRFIKDFYEFDLWLQGLAPSVGLLNDWNNGKLTWEEYEERYLKEIRNKEDNLRGSNDIRELRGIIEREEVITLLCAEKEDTYCHRRLLKEYIESIENKES